jgi:amidase
MIDETRWMDATAQAELVARGQASPAELVDAAIERIEKFDPAVNAVIHPRFEKARAEARGELPDGPFRGVPIVIKDLGAASAGDPCHWGTRFLRRAGYLAARDSAEVARLRRAGFVIVGRTSAPEFGLTITTEPKATGPTRNPWNLERSTGGSSGGSAAAVAAGMVPVGQASDGGGSIRIPASNCGLVGLKPTRARVSMGPDAGEGWAGASIHGAVTHSVRDAAAVLDCMAGEEPGDPYPAPPLVRPLIEEVGAAPGRLRIGVLDGPPRAVAPDPQVRAGVRATADLLADLGHDVVDAHPSALGDPDFGSRYGTITSSSVAAELARWERVLGEPIDPDLLEEPTRYAMEYGRTLTAAAYVEAVQWMHGYTRRLRSWWELDGFDLLLCPVLNGPPTPIGWYDDPATAFDRIAELLHYTAEFNISGQPGISLPLHMSSDGLPIGMQLVGGYGREDVLIRVAAQLELARPWSGRRPPLD